MIAPRELDTLPQQWVEGNATYDKGLQRRVFDTGRTPARRSAVPATPPGVFGSGANMAFRTDYLRRRRGFDAGPRHRHRRHGRGRPGRVLRRGHAPATGSSTSPARSCCTSTTATTPRLRRQTYGYGAGLGAHLTRCLIDDPRLVVALARSRADGAPPGPHDRAPAGRRRPAGRTRPT